MTGHATSTLTINGVQVTVSTDGTNGNSSDAVKTFVDARISISPQTANNPVGANHVLTATVQVNNGSGGGFVPAPDGTSISFSIVSGPGSFTTPNPCTTSGGTGSCTITLVSNTAGTTIVSASTMLSVGGVSLTRTTGTAANTASGGSGNATKNWMDDVVTTKVRDAANNDVTGTTVQPGTVLHDEATVAKAAGTPAAAPTPTGTVNFVLYSTGTCSGNTIPASSQSNVALNGSGLAVMTTTFTAPAAGGSFSYRATYSGDPNYPSHQGPCETFNVPLPPVGQILPTQTTCNDYIGGGLTPLGTINYSVSNGKITQSVNPGVFFFYTKVTVTAGQVVTVTQDNNASPKTALFSVKSANAFTATCGTASRVSTSVSGSNSGNVTYTFTNAGTYVIQVKYDSKSVSGTTAPATSPTTYTFTLSGGFDPSLNGSFQFVKQ